ncbi:hypothetical protein L4C37_15050 [Vibrio kagoshimensis]|uniref:hypothetical protein n=1 Tax=Vibrio kagoshimensis TaxID=2910244 RepID=UPI003D1F87B2
MKFLMLLSVLFSTNAISADGSTNVTEEDHQEFQMLNQGSSNRQEANNISDDSRDFQLFGYKPLKIEPHLESQAICESIVCESIKEAESVPVIGDVPKREGNKTIEALTSAIYIAGEIGLADNRAEPDPETPIFD